MLRAASRFHVPCVPTAFASARFTAQHDETESKAKLPKVPVLWEEMDPATAIRQVRVPRLGLSAFLGKMADDKKVVDGLMYQEARDAISVARAACLAAIRINDSSAGVEVFIAQARHVQGVLEKHATLQDGSTNPFYLNPFLMFNGDGTPAQPMIRLMLERCYTAAADVAWGRRNNFSGYCISGPRGTGKSTVMRLVAVLSGLLLPNFVGMYIEAASVARPQDMLPQLLFQAYKEVELVSEHSFPPHVLARRTSIDELLEHAYAQGVCTGIFVDEIKSLYTPHHWAQLHQFASSTVPKACVLADSSSVAGLLVHGSDVQQLQDILKRPPLPSLNATRIKVHPMMPLRTREEYERYFKALPLQSIRGKKVEKLETFIRRAHLRCAGSICSLVMYQESSRPGLIPMETIRTYPLKATVYHQVFKAMVADAARRVSTEAPKEALGVLFDPFDLPTFTEAKMMEFIHSIPGNRGFLDLFELVERSLLYRIADDCYTWYQPLHFLVAKQTVRAAVSFRLDAAGQGALTQLKAVLGGKIDLIACTDAASQDALHMHGIQAWMQHQFGTQRNPVIVLATDSYLDRVETHPTSGVAKEFTAALKEGGPKSTFFVRSGEINDEFTMRLHANIKRVMGDDSVPVPLVYAAVDPKRTLLANITGNTPPVGSSVKSAYTSLSAVAGF